MFSLCAEQREIRLASSADILSFSQLPKRLHAVRSAGSELQNNPGDCSAREGSSARESAPLKRGSVSEVRSRGALSLAERPALPAERTAYQCKAGRV